MNIRKLTIALILFISSQSFAQHQGTFLLVGDSITDGIMKSLLNDPDLRLGDPDGWYGRHKWGSTLLNIKEGLESHAWLYGSGFDMIVYGAGLHSVFEVGGKPRESIAEYASGLDEILKSLKATGSRIVLRTMTGVEYGNGNRDNKNVQKYNNVAKYVAAQNDVEVVDFYERLTETVDANGELLFDPELTLSPAGIYTDGVHFTQEATDLLAQWTKEIFYTEPKMSIESEQVFSSCRIAAHTESFSAVPEPSAIAIALPCLTLMGLRQRRSH